MEKRKWYFEKIWILLFISFLWIELTFHVITFHTLWEPSVIRIILFSLVGSLFLSFLFSLVPFSYSRIGILVMVLFVSIYAMAQLGFDHFMGNYMSLNAATDGAGRVGDYVIEFIRYIKPTYYLCLLPFVILTILLFWKKEWFSYEKWNWKHFGVIATIFILLHVVSLGTLHLEWFQNKNQIKSNKELYQEPTLIELSLRQFGTVRFLWRDIVYMIMPGGAEEIPIVDVPGEEIPEPVEPDYNRVIDDTEWIKKMEAETDPVMKNLDEYFLSQPITPKNEMTGMFKGKNLILIMVEAFDMSAIHEEVTPTLYRLSQEGWYFDHYYTPKYSCTTGESEFIGLTSIIPLSTVCTPNTYRNNLYTEAIFSLFNQSNYYSSSYHNWTDEFYERKTIHRNMGSSFFYNHADLNIERVNGWPSDLDMMEKAIPHFIDNTPFFSFMITSSTHFPYDIDSTVVNKNWDKVKNLPYSMKMKRYLAKASELDQGIEYLLNSLEEKGILDDTVIVIFGDHHPLKMELSYLNEASSIDRYEDFNGDRLPFIIYNHSMEAKTISKTSSTFDIVPTLANLFDLEYDPRKYIGKDIFSDEETTVIFTNGSWITDKAMYFSSSGKYKALVDDLEEDYITQTNQKVKNWFTVSEQVLKKDYFRYR